MRSCLLTAAILAASVCALPAVAPLAEEIRQPWAATSTSRDPHYSEDTWQSILLSHDVQGALGKEVRSGTGENLGRIVDVLVDQGGQVRRVVREVCVHLDHELCSPLEHEAKARHP